MMLSTDSSNLFPTVCADCADCDRVDGPDTNTHTTSDATHALRLILVSIPFIILPPAPRRYNHPALL